MFHDVTRNWHMPTWPTRELNVYFTEGPDLMPSMSAPWGGDRGRTRPALFPNGARSLAENDKLQLGGARRRLVYERVSHVEPLRLTGHDAHNDDWVHVGAERAGLWQRAKEVVGRVWARVCGAWSTMFGA